VPTGERFSLSLLDVKFITSHIKLIIKVKALGENQFFGFFGRALWLILANFRRFFAENDQSAPKYVSWDSNKEWGSNNADTVCTLSRI